MKKITTEQLPDRRGGSRWFPLSQADLVSVNDDSFSCIMDNCGGVMKDTGTAWPVAPYMGLWHECDKCGATFSIRENYAAAAHKHGQHLAQDYDKSRVFDSDPLATETDQ